MMGEQMITRQPHRTPPSTLTFAALVALLAPLAGCPAEPASERPQQSPGASGGAAGAGAADTFACPHEDDVLAFGVPETGAPACLDTTQHEAVGCEGGDESAPEHCFERLADGARYWVPSLRAGGWDAAHWRPCPSAGDEPPACFTQACGDRGGPASTCSPADTAERFGCGLAGTAWDTACCGRAACSPDGTCPDGFVCSDVLVRAEGCHVRRTSETCECLGTPGGQTERLCVEANAPTE